MKLRIPDPKPRTLVRFHAVMMVVWFLAVFPTITSWKESIMWIAFMSVYAEFVGHFAGLDAARAEETTSKIQARIERKLDALLESHGHDPGMFDHGGID